jgi:ATP-dependent DNA helicase RecG
MASGEKTLAASNLFDWELRKLLADVATRPSSELESETIEFKGYATEQSLHNAKDLPEELSALANHKGGTIVVGVRAETEVQAGQWAQQIVGINGADPITVAERLRGKLKPAVDLRVREANIDGKYFILIGIAHPRNTLVATSSGKVYIRDGRSSRPMAPDEIEAAVKALANYDWSADPIDLPAFESLDSTALSEAHAEFCARRGLSNLPDVPAFLEAIGATSNGALLRGGLMFLGKDDVIRESLGDYEYRFAWKTKAGALVENDVWSGCIWTAVKRSKQHFSKCNTVQQFKYKEDETTFSAPLLDETAFHEAYLNALVHRDYSSEGMVSVLFTGDQMTISSPGGFYGGVNAENIALHEPRHRNKLLARILMNYHMVDRAGMGVLRMGLGALRYGRSFPKFSEAPDGVEVSMEAQYLKIPVAALALRFKDTYGIAELLILNSVVETGVIPIADVLKGLARLIDNPWKATLGAIATLNGIVELCGTQSGIFIRVRPQWKSFMEVGREFNPSKNSDKHVTLFRYLKQHGTASNANLREALGHTHSSQTSSFLRHAKYVQRTGSGPSARWSLVS